MKQDLTKFKTPKWRKATKDCVKLWEERTKGKKMNRLSCPLCVAAGNPNCYISNCQKCIAYSESTDMNCLEKWSCIGDFYEQLTDIEDGLDSTRLREQAKKTAARVLKIAQRMEELTR